MANQPDYETIRRRAEKRVNELNEFYLHFGVYVIVNVAVWGLWLFLKTALSWGILEFPWPILVTLGWGIGLAIHALTVYVKTRLSSEKVIQREIDRELRYHGLTAEELMEKPKRGRDLRLSDDGELVPNDDDEVIKRKRDHR